MTFSEEVRERRDCYPLPADSAAEIARLIDQSFLMRQAIGGLLPGPISVRPGQVILDLACGPGEWATEVARLYRDTEVIGVDANPTVIRVARASASAQRIENLFFEVRDITKSLGYEDKTFDVIHARFLVAVLTKTTWPILLAACHRLLKPGGALVLTECEGLASNSPALHRLQQALFQAFFRQVRTFSLDGTSLGMISMLGKLLRDAGFTQVWQQPFLLDASLHAPLRVGILKNLEILFLLLKPYLLQSEVLTNELFEQLYWQMTMEVRSDNFTGTSVGMSAIGYKREEQ